MSIKSLSIIMILTSIALASCKQKTAENPPVATAEEILANSTNDQYASESDIPRGIRIVKNMRDKIPLSDIAPMNQEAEAIFAHRIKNAEKKTWSVMTAGYYEYAFVFNGKEMSKPGEHAGRWLNFKEDNTYDYGYYSDVQGSGKYYFDLDDELLLMVDNNKNIKPNEYKCKPVNDVCILIGTEVYKDNNFQCKIERVDAMPSKS